MTLKKEILEKVPNYLKEEPEFKALLEHIKKYGIEGKEELKEHLGKEIKLVEKWLEENRKKGGTMVKEMRDKAVKLKVLKRCEEIRGKIG